MKRFTIILFLFALVLTACQSTGANAKGKATNEVAKVTPSPDKTALNVALDATPSPADLVIVFERSGGFAGVDEKWSIYTGGKIVKENGDTFSVDAAKVTALLDAAEAANFFEMKASSAIGSVSNCKDCFSYKLTITSNGQTNTITTSDGATGLPDAFMEILKQIKVLIVPPTQ